ncbi:MAG: hypothetical protein N2Z74_04625, partial [Syntrophales bacterium]|nr:hypothetical protein [Syntrophales bacterium]
GSEMCIRDRVVGPFLDHHGEFALVVPRSVDADLVEGRGFFRTWPHRQGMDGFFGALMIRRETE